MNREPGFIPVFTGSAKACLKHFASTLPQAKELIAEGRRELKDFVGLQSDDGIYRWIAGTTEPISVGLIRLRYYLWHKGYELEEFQGLNQIYFDLGEFFAFNLVTFEEVKETCGFFTITTFGKTLLGQVDCRPDKFGKIQKLVAKLKREREGGLLLAINKIAIHKVSLPKPLPKVEAEIKPQLKVQIPSVANGHAEVISAFSAIVEAGLPLARLIISDEFTDQERRELRERFGDDGLFLFSTMLGALCSREARRYFLQEAKGATK